MARSFPPLHSARQRLHTGLLQPEHRAPSLPSSCTEDSFWEGLGGPVYFSSSPQIPGAEAQESGSEALPWAQLPQNKYWDLENSSQSSRHGGSIQERHSEKALSYFTKRIQPVTEKNTNNNKPSSSVKGWRTRAAIIYHLIYSASNKVFQGMRGNRQA